MASKLPKLILPVYDLKVKPLTYHHYAEAVYKANASRREAMSREAVDKAWVTAVKDYYPNNKAKREKLCQQVGVIHYIHRSSSDAATFWEKFERDEPRITDHFHGARTLGTFPINGTNIALPICQRFVYKMDYVRFASALLPRVNPGLTCTRSIVDDAWAATIEQTPGFRKAPKVKEKALANAKSQAARDYWKKRSDEPEN
ncbi:MAG: hypothetical protein M1830_000289 [Pleopsidium flavum]|nr:MAG: hypothetical protein M1830_000289 [Pleopsidium flavum]